MTTPICKTASTTRQISKGHSVGGFSSVSNVPPQNASLRIKLCKLGSGARSILRISAANRTYKDHRAGGSSDILHKRALSDESWVSPQGGVTPLNKTPSKVQQVRVTNDGRGDAKQAAMKLWSTDHSSLSEADTPGAWEFKEGAVRWHGQASPLCDHPVFLDSKGRTEWAENEVTTGESAQGYRALIDAMFQIGDRGGTPNLGMPVADTLAEAGTNRQAQEGRRKKERPVGGSRDEADARRAWEATKRRIIYLEEFGAQPDDVEDAELSSREHRARWRKGWAEEAMRVKGKAREDASLRAAKQRRRQAGWWIRENGAFVRLVSKSPPVSLSFSYRDQHSVSYGLTRFSVHASKMRALRPFEPRRSSLGLASNRAGDQLDFCNKKDDVAIA
ncbi:hypothetical protein F5148DRAFT_152434 [Russula earlei]|uniref:Uncharacterized protein n=1 Tax=Russula earlei TaxID=71964 RepID=A0ACC0U610_9AGAM|nr:hypothetical protein F5148DRAFT_152434 [Russula earlei]